jgi:hypothetical protein
VGGRHNHASGFSSAASALVSLLPAPRPSPLGQNINGTPSARNSTAHPAGPVGIPNRHYVDLSPGRLVRRTAYGALFKPCPAISNLPAPAAPAAASEPPSKAKSKSRRASPHNPPHPRGQDPTASPSYCASLWVLLDFQIDLGDPYY